MNNRNLGIAGMIAAPFLFIDSLANITGGKILYRHNSLGGVFDLIYITGWICSIIGLFQINAAGNKWIGKLILCIQMFLLFLANVWNVLEIITPGSNSPLYHFLDNFWPISNLFMLVTGITILIANQLKGLDKFLPLLVGLWLPLYTIPSIIFHLNNPLSLVIITGIYSVVVWFLLGHSVYRSGKFSKPNLLPHEK